MAGEYTGQVMLDGVTAFLKQAAPHLAAGADPRPERGSPARSGPVEDGADPPARILHRLPRAADLRGAEAGPERPWQAPDQRRYRLPPVRRPATVRDRRRDHGLWPRPRRQRRLRRRGRAPPDLDHRGRRILAQRSVVVLHQHGLQQVRRPRRRRRQLLFRRDRRAGHHVVAGRRTRPRPPAIRSRGRSGASACHWVREIDQHLRGRQAARFVPRGADHGRGGAEGHRGLVGMHAEPPAPRKAAARHRRSARGVGSRRHALASTRRSAPAITPASGCRAVPRSASSGWTIRCATIRWPRIDQSCVGCGNCGEVADAAILCPSFYRADVVHNPAGHGAASCRVPRPHHRLAATAPIRPAARFRGGRMTRHEPLAPGPAAPGPDGRHQACDPRGRRAGRRRPDQLDRGCLRGPTAMRRRRHRWPACRSARAPRSTMSRCVPPPTGLRSSR